MPHLPGVVASGIPEATRVAQSVIHRGAEAAMAVVAGERVDRIRAERIPEAGAGERITERQRRERQGDRGDTGGRAPERDDEGPSGGLVDLQA
jgi:hypothetical protein